MKTYTLAFIIFLLVALCLSVSPAQADCGCRASPPSEPQQSPETAPEQPQQEQAQPTPTYITIEQLPDVTALMSSGIAVRTHERIILENEKAFIETHAGSKELAILPFEAHIRAAESATHKVEEIELGREHSTLTYTVRGSRQARLFSLIPITVARETKINAETGSITVVTEPLWAFFAW